MIHVYFDGSCGPKNPGGTAAWGFVVKDEEYNVLYTAYGRVGTGPLLSNNCAEFAGLYEAMKYIRKNFQKENVCFHGDSTLVIELMNKRAQAKKGLYLPYYKKSAELAEPYIQAKQWSFEWIVRDLNSEADELAQYSRFQEKGH